jgi:hypothetical protein
MKNYITLGFISATLILMSCDKENLKANIDCESLTNGLLVCSIEQVKTEMDKVTEDLFPEPTDNDQIGQRENINLLIERLNSQCATIEAKLKCYACVKTLPAQSEIAVSLDSLGVKVEKVLDISTPDDEKLAFIRIH